ncbi:MAG: chorion class high-cysteine HCB protein 13 [Lachnospiraceae bacterium]
MSDITATNCGCERDCGCGCGEFRTFRRKRRMLADLIWILFASLRHCGGNDGCGRLDSASGQDNCCWILLLLLCCGGFGNGGC